MSAIFQNHALVAGLIAMFLAQFMKPFTNYWLNKEWDFSQIFASGGMPSSHSSFVTATALVTGMRRGFDSEVFAVAAAISVMRMRTSARR